MEDDLPTKASHASQGMSITFKLWATMALRLMVGLLLVLAIVNRCLDGDGHQASSFTDRIEHAVAVVEHRFLALVPAYSQGLATSTCDRVCGEVSVPYPFGLSPGCARNSYFQLECRNTSLIRGSAVEFQSGLWPFLTNVSGSFKSGPDTLSKDEIDLEEHSMDSFQVLDIDGPVGTLLINVTAIKAYSCDGNDVSTYGNASIVLPDGGPYRSSIGNLLFAAGCSAQNQYSESGPIQDYDDTSSDGGKMCTTACSNQHGPFPFCNAMGCCTVAMPPITQIFLRGGGNCGYGAVLYPASYATPTPYRLATGTYGMQINWALEEQQENCSVIETLEGYACSKQAQCEYRDYVGYGITGYICQCMREGFEGDGYRDGTDCKDVDECKSSNRTINQCADGALCTNLIGSYDCSCPSLMEGDGYRNGTGCTYIDFCSQGHQNDCSENAFCKSNLGLYNCSCPSKLTGDGRVNGTGCKDKSENLALTIGISAGVGGFLLLCLCVAIPLLWKFWKQVISFREIEKALAEQKVQPPFYSYNELKVATRDFHPENKLGEGAFGAVYKGVLLDGTMLAVKKLFNSKSNQVLSEFLNEVVLITGLKHRHLIQLKGCCIKENQRILVYEYAPNGNLAEALWAKPREDGRVLSWEKRLDICVGVARGLSYLHEELQPRIIHRDIKPANILLDKDLNPKIADFGLAKPFLDEQSHVQYTHVAGTMGYFAPEYATQGELTEKADVYSFGILALEIVSGRKWIDDRMTQEEMFLKNWAQRLHKEGRLMDLLQIEIRKSCIEIEVTRVINIALICVQMDPIRRATMSQVVTMLLGTMDVTVFLDTSNYRQPDFNLLKIIDEPYHSDRWPSTTSQTLEVVREEDSSKRSLLDKDIELSNVLGSTSTTIARFNLSGR